MESFAKQLRLHCARKGSIAQLCKATGINRQQFNKYLAGQMLPGARTMRKICSYLGVSEEQLMTGSVPPAAQDPAPPEIDLGTLFPHIAAVQAGQPARDPLQNGFYRAFFPVRSQPGLVACWLVHIAEGPGGTQVHTCRNRFQNGAALGFAADRITYGGPVIYGAGDAALMGTARSPLSLKGIIFVNLNPLVERDYFSAMVLTRRPDGPLALSGALQFLGHGCTPRSALSGIGLLDLDDPQADPVIVQMMRTAPAAGTNWIRSPAERNLQDQPGGSSLPAAVAIRRLSV